MDIREEAEKQGLSREEVEASKRHRLLHTSSLPLGEQGGVLLNSDLPEDDDDAVGSSFFPKLSESSLMDSPVVSAVLQSHNLLVTEGNIETSICPMPNPMSTDEEVLQFPVITCQDTCLSHQQPLTASSLQANSSCGDTAYFITKDDDGSGGGDFGLPADRGSGLGTSRLQQTECQWSGCFRKFSVLEHLVSHVNECHVQPNKSEQHFEAYSCQWKDCSRKGKGFNARYKMLIHVRTHTNEKPHQCSVCHKQFSRLENLKIHNRSHTGEKPYTCPVAGCSKRYSNSSDRFKHTRTHYTEKPYSCKLPGCSKSYTDPSSLRKHIKTHRHYPKKAANSVTEEHGSGGGEMGSGIILANSIVSKLSQGGNASATLLPLAPSSFLPEGLSLGPVSGRTPGFVLVQAPVGSTGPSQQLSLLSVPASMANLASGPLLSSLVTTPSNLVSVTGGNGGGSLAVSSLSENEKNSFDPIDLTSSLKPGKKHS